MNSGFYKKVIKYGAITFLGALMTASVILNLISFFNQYTSNVAQRGVEIAVEQIYSIIKQAGKVTISVKNASGQLENISLIPEQDEKKK